MNIKRSNDHHRPVRKLAGNVVSREHFPNLGIFQDPRNSWDYEKNVILIRVTCIVGWSEIGGF